MHIVLFVMMMTSGQLLFKATSRRTFSTPADLLLDWKFLLAVAVYGAATILWIHILKSMPLSTAYPLAMGATIALTSLLGIGIFNEGLTAAKAIGIGLVIIAMFALSR
jgi:undecaprenyl phosphate-alpha-L-ara4N flippase subunit ArnE